MNDLDDDAACVDFVSVHLGGKILVGLELVLDAVVLPKAGELGFR